jgi:hypothetical protein
MGLFSRIEQLSAERMKAIGDRADLTRQRGDVHPDDAARWGRRLGDKINDLNRLIAIERHRGRRH